MSEGFPEEIVAPHGRAADGTPLAPYGYGTRGHPRKRALSPGDRRFRANKAGRAGGKKKVSRDSRRTTADSGDAPDFTEDILGLLQMAALPLAMHPATFPDAWAINRYAPGVAEAANSVAQDRPEVAAMLLRLQKAGPYAALVSALTPLIIQLSANHRILPAALVGAATREEIMEEMREEMEAAEAAEAAEARQDDAEAEWAREAMRRAAEVQVPEGGDEWDTVPAPDASGMVESPPIEFHRQPGEETNAFFDRIEAQTGAPMPDFTGVSDAD